MDGAFLVRGMIVGLGIAAPVGPIGLLCIQRTLTHGWPAGLASGLGAASADALYGSVAAFGLALVTTFLVEQRMWLGLAGGAFLLYLGVRTLLSRPAERAAAAADGRSLWAHYASTFALTLTNPMTILAFAAILAGAGLATGAGRPAAAAVMVAGVFLGSALWWLVLSALVTLARGRIGTRALLWVNRAAGLLLIAFGLAALYSVLPPAA